MENNRYIDIARQSAHMLSVEGHASILAIETSCDETAAAIVQDGREILGQAIFTQIPMHEVFGGVVPEIASRSHVETIGPVVKKALLNAGMGFSDIDAVAVTSGPGLVGALLCGISYAKAYAYALGVPLIGVHHIESQLSANYIVHKDLHPPFIGLAVSGGHTHWFYCRDHGDYRLLGHTLDDAAGEAFDKIARLLGFPYPGAALLDKAAEEGNDKAYALPHVRTKKPLSVSFSGLKTAMRLIVEEELKKHPGSAPIKDMAASYRRAIVKQLIDNTRAVLKETGEKKLVVAGGVAANSLLRRELETMAKEGVAVYMPTIELCTDNAAMVGASAYYRLMRGDIDDMSLNARPTWEVLRGN